MLPRYPLSLFALALLAPLAAHAQGTPPVVEGTLVEHDGQIVATESDLRGEDLLKTLEKHLGPPAEASASN